MNYSGEIIIKNNKINNDLMNKNKNLYNEYLIIFALKKKSKNKIKIIFIFISRILHIFPYFL